MNFIYWGKSWIGSIQACQFRAISCIHWVAVVPVVPEPAFALPRCGQTLHAFRDYCFICLIGSLISIPCLSPQWMCIIQFCNFHKFIIVPNAHWKISSLQTWSAGVALNLVIALNFGIPWREQLTRYLIQMEHYTWYELAASGFFYLFYDIFV